MCARMTDTRTNPGGNIMRRFAVVLATLAIAGCATFGGRGGEIQDAAWATARLNPDTLMRIAVTQLEHHGYTVQRLGERSVMTVPRTVPNYLRDASAPAAPAEQWVIRVNVDQVPFMGNSRVAVSAFLLPSGGAATTAGTSGAAALERATPVTSENERMFAQVETVARWISDAAKRHGD